MNNIIEFKPKKDNIYILSFVMPDVITMNKTGNENITLEAKNGKGHAYVIAENRTEAKEKLLAMIPSITEWID
jgi:hypothetical protein